MSMAAVKPQGQKGICGILLPHHVYINKYACYASTPYPHLLKNLKKEEPALVGHSNMELGGMEMSGEMGAVEQMWLNEGVLVVVRRYPKYSRPSLPLLLIPLSPCVVRDRGRQESISL